LFPSRDSLNLTKEELEWYRNFYHEEKKKPEKLTMTTNIPQAQLEEQIEQMVKSETPKLLV
jgi:hypothetical protein